MKGQNADAGFEALLFPLKDPTDTEDENTGDCPGANFWLLPPLCQDGHQEQVVDEECDQAGAFDVEATGGEVGAPFTDANHPEHEAPGGVIEELCTGGEPACYYEAREVAGQSEAA